MNEMVFEKSATGERIKLIRYEKEILFWVDPATADPSDFINMIAHEKGHLTRPFKRDGMKEEYKAQRYGDAASFAFNVCRDIFGETCLQSAT